jgi:hypothetical protein
MVEIRPDPSMKILITAYILSRDALVKTRRTGITVCVAAIISGGWGTAAYGIPDLYIKGRVPIYIEKPSGRLFLSAGQDVEMRSGPFINQDKDRITSRIKSEYRTRGWVYHPALVVFTAGLRPEYKWQAETEQSGFDQEDTGVFFGYYIDTTWLQFKPYTISLFSSNDRSDTASTLAPDITTETSIHRLGLNLKYPVLPTTITLEKRDSVSEGLFRSGDAHDLFRIESKKETEKSRTTLKIEGRAQDREIRESAFSTDWFSTYIYNNYAFNKNINLSSGLSYSDSSSARRDTTVTRLTSRLRIRHRENFSTNYAARVEARDETQFSAFTSSLSAGLSHRLYENLTTAFNVNATRNSLNDGELNTYTGDLGFTYRRRIPWGMLNINLGGRERVEDDRHEAEFSEVRGESHTFSGALTDIFLNNDNIDESSIVVTDADGLITFVPGIDYFVSAVGDSVRISRDPFAGIGDDQVIIVDYRFESDPPAVTGLTSANFGVNLLLLDKLTLFYQRNDSMERLISGIRPDELTDDTVQLAGAELRWRWSTTRVELEDRDTTRTPLRRFQIRETLAFRLGSRFSFGLGADYSELTLQDTGEVTEGVGANANLSWRIGGTGQLRVRAFMRRNRSNTVQTDSTGLVSVYDWRYGAWRPSLRYEFANDENKISDDRRKRHTIYFQVERQFN